ncbi:unnamed protein product [Linum tenue]|uniref:Uncharacterized protein n=1 Tax=Linum tenue TaxID=586396 RepID=A0AAV0NXB3_9ROSI|nr:unnamed protein product [Linum tenue]
MGRSALQMTTSSSLGGDFGGWSALLMIWTWERFSHTSHYYMRRRVRRLLRTQCHVAFDGFRPTPVSMEISSTCTSCGLTSARHSWLVYNISFYRIVLIDLL